MVFSYIFAVASRKQQSQWKCLNFDDIPFFAIQALTVLSKCKFLMATLLLFYFSLVSKLHSNIVGKF